MSPLLRGGLFASALVFVAACVDLGQATTPPTARPSTPATTTQPTTAATIAPEPTSAVTIGPTPTTAATGGPSASLDPTLSDAGIAGRVTVINDVRADRDGTYDIYGVADDGSECSGAFEDDYLVVAWYDDAPEGQIRRLGVSVAHEDVPSSDGSTTDITDGGVSFDISGSFIGGTYSGNATVENEGSSTIDVTRSGQTLVFDFEAVTNDGVNFFGQLICAEV